MDQETHHALPLAEHILEDLQRRPQPPGEPYRITGELQLEQIEHSTVPCTSLTDLVQALRTGRTAVDEAAQHRGARAVALATSPLPVSPHLRPHPRYSKVAQMHGIVTTEQLIGGMHVHVEVATAEEGVAVLDRIRVWLPLLLALSANSPYWQGQDTGYCSFRSRVWSRWPTSGPTPLFGSAAAYDSHVQGLLGTGVILDKDMIYFDARLSSHYPTVEIRAMDVCQELQSAELIAGLIRALVEASVRDWHAGKEPSPVSESLLRVAMWRAAQSGMTGDLLDPYTLRPVPAAQLAATLMTHLGGCFEAAGEEARLRGLLSRHVQRGSGAQQQRRDFALHARLVDVVHHAVLATHAPDPMSYHSYEGKKQS